MAEQVGSETVAQFVGRDAVVEPREIGVALEVLPEPLAGERTTAGGDEEGGGAVLAREREQPLARPIHPAPDGIASDIAERHDALLAALAPDADEAAVEVEAGDGEQHEFADPESGGVEELEHGDVAQPFVGRLAGGAEQLFDLLFAPDLGQVPGDAGDLDERRRVDLDERFDAEELEEAAEAYDVACEGSRLEPLVESGEQVGVEVAGADGGGGGEPLFDSPGGEGCEVCAVGRERVLGQAALDAEVLEVALDGLIQAESGIHRSVPCAL